MKLGGCIRRNAFLKIGVSSGDCHQCSGCNHDTNISRSRSDALRRHNAERSNTAVVTAAFETLQKRCLLCRHAKCNGISACRTGTCFGCGRIHPRKHCIVRPANFLPTNIAAVYVGLGTETFMAIAITDPQKKWMILADIGVNSKD